MAVPPFHETGDPAGHFFALAFASGRYVSPSGATNKPAFLVLYFSNSADFTPFTYMTVSTERERLSYHRGDDVLRTVEYAILRAWELEGVPLGAWNLYPRATVDAHVFTDAATHEAYWENRRRLCMVLYRARAAASLAAQIGKVEPLFRFDGTLRHLHDGDPDNDEIWNTVVELLPDTSGNDGDE